MVALRWHYCHHCAMFQIIAAIAVIVRPSTKPRDCFAAAFGSKDAFQPCTDRILVTKIQL